MRKTKKMVAFAMAMFMLVPSSLFASSHREAPITALDRTADITDWYAFVSYDHPDRVTMILNVDPFLEPSNAPDLLVALPESRRSQRWTVRARKV